MREISVDLDVFSAIWAKRIAPESTENEILRRLLSVGEKEVKTSGRPSGQQWQQPTEQKEKLMRTSFKIRWIDDVLGAFQLCGGEADLASIYRHVDEIRRDRGEKPIKTLEATVRRTIEDHSSDSDNFRAHDYFEKVERGRWRLR